MNSCAIPLTNGKGETIVDPEDFERLSRYSWGVDRKGYARRMVWDAGDKKSIYLHREIMKADDGDIVDHVNRNTLDNRKANLRLATPAQNSANRSAKRTKRGGVKFIGVHKNSKGSTYSAIFRGKHLGCFRDQAEAARCYDAAARAFFGDYASQNFPST